MRQRVWILAVVLGLGLALHAGAATKSLIDPPVTLDLKDAPLSEVVKAVSAQTGALLTTPAIQVMGQMPPQMRERMDPKVTITVKDASLQDVLSKLRAQGLQTMPQGNGGWMIMPTGRQPAADAKDDRPSVQVGNYRLLFNGLVTERIVNRSFTVNAPQREAMRVELEVQATSEVGRRALYGGSTDYAIKLDGKQVAAQLAPVPPGGEPLVRLNRGAFGQQQFTLQFAHPAADPDSVDLLTGGLLVYPDAKERIFEFDGLDQANQKQTDGDVDVTLTRFTTRPGGNGAATWQADVSVAMPVDAQLVRRLGGAAGGVFTGPQFFGNPAMPGGNWNGPGIPGGGEAAPPPPIFLDFDGIVPARPGEDVDVLALEGAEPANVNLWGDRLAEDRVILAQAPAAPPRPEVPVVPAPPGRFIVPLPGGMPLQPPAEGLMPGMAGPRGMTYGITYGDTNPLMPVAMVETDTGRTRALSISQAGQTRAADGTTSLRIVFNGTVGAEPPRRLLVAVVDYGKRTSSLPFVFKGIRLPLPIREGQPRP